MADERIVTGDAVNVVIQLKDEKNRSFAISDTAIVKYTIVSNDKNTLIIDTPLTSLKTYTGAVWSESKIVLKFSRNDTKDINFYGRACYEIQITENVGTADECDKTWFIPVDIVRGNIL